MERGLIDPLNEDTYDDRVIVHSSIIKSHLPTPAYRRGWDKAFGPKWIIKFNYKKKKYVSISL